MLSFHRANFGSCVFKKNVSVAYGATLKLFLEKEFQIDLSSYNAVKLVQIPSQKGLYARPAAVVAGIPKKVKSEIHLKKKSFKSRY